MTRLVVRVLGIHHAAQRAINCIRPRLSVYSVCVSERCVELVNRRELIRHVGGASAATAARPIIVLPAYA